MKIPRARRSRGFTLVELLVVIAIIAILAAAGFAAGNAAIQKARKTTSLAAASAVETAVNNFFTEYQTMPYDGSSDMTVDTSSDTKLLNALLGLDDTINTRKIKFLDVKEGKAKKNGLIYNSNGTNVQGLYDPWGGGYHVMLDLDYDEKVSVPSGVKDGGKTLNGRRVAVWSKGADGVKGSGNANDDVVTW